MKENVLVALLLIAMSLLMSCQKDNGDTPVVPQKKTFTITYNANGAESGTVPQSVIAEEGSVITIADGSVLIRNGFVFSGWNTNEKGTGYDYAVGDNYKLNSDVTLYAKWSTSQNESKRMKITIGTTVFTATLYESDAVNSFKKMMPLTLEMIEFNGNEKYASLSSSISGIPSSPGTIQSGDIMLWGSNTLVLFYDTFSTSYSYVKLGKIDDVQGLPTVLGSGNVIVKFEME